MQRKGIILAGGSGTRLHPLTKVISKQLLPVYDKPMIYYPLSTLMLAGVRDILIITTPNDRALFEALLGDGSQWGINLSYIEQPSPDGLAQAFILAENFLNGQPSVMVLGDNIFYGNDFQDTLIKADSCNNGATVFTFYAKDPERYGVAEFNENDDLISIEEKPSNPKSNFVVSGLYFYDNNVSEYAKSLRPSKRNELEITDLNNIYLNQGALACERFGRGFTWMDAGTHDSLMDAGQLIKTIENSHGLKIACLEEIAYRNQWIDQEALESIIHGQKNTDMKHYLKMILEGAA
tara:strand:+ start:12092 stop:12970 length:879 start_codon:yes stop_codon:yes gene_type:complete